MLTPGFHNACICGIALITALFLLFTVARLTDALYILRLVERATISFLPRASVAARQFPTLIDKHRIEFTSIMQQAPPPRVLPVHMLFGHLEAIALDMHQILKLEIIGRASCRVFINVTLTCIAKCIAVLRENTRQPTSTQRQPLLLSDQVSAEQVLLNESDWASVAQKFSESILHVPLTHLGEIQTLVVVLTSDTHTEITVANDQSLTVSLQVVVMRDGSVVEIKGIYTQSEECLICYEHPASMVLLPCRHCSICNRCVRQLREPKCIVCRHPFDQYIETSSN